MHTGGVTPAVARRLLFGIVAACLAVTAGVALLRPATPAPTAPQSAAVSEPGLPYDVLPQQFVVPADGSTWRSYGVDGGVVTVHVHGLPGQIAASP
jgi:hypothetical protein